MFRWVYIERNLPIAFKSISANLNEGLQGLHFWGYLLILFGLIVLLIFIIKKRNFFPFIISVLFFFYGGILINRGNIVLEKRKNCFSNGVVVFGTVIKHGKSFNPYALQNYYSIDLKVKNEIISIRHKSKSLWLSCPIGEKIIGLNDRNNYFFGPELGCIFKLFKPKSE